MIYNYLTFIDSINNDCVSLIKKLKQFTIMPKDKSRQNVIFNRHRSIISIIKNNEES